MKLVWVRLPGSARWLAAALLLLTLAATVLLRRFPVFGSLLLARPSTCTLKVLTGTPCLACRGTRAAFALAQGDPARAFAFNPLATLFITLILTAAALVALRGTLPILQNLPRPWLLLLSTLGALTLLANWAYVIAAGG